jgi:hypothetical protein
MSYVRLPPIEGFGGASVADVVGGVVVLAVSAIVPVVVARAALSLLMMVLTRGIE